MAKAPVIAQGDVFWIRSEALRPAVPGADHPHVVVQADVLNQSRISTVVVCGVTSNMNRANEPGNVRLKAGEANLPRPSTVLVSQVCTVEKSALGERIGTLDEARVQLILDGLRFQQQSFFQRQTD